MLALVSELALVSVLALVLLTLEQVWKPAPEQGWAPVTERGLAIPARVVLP